MDPGNCHNYDKHHNNNYNKKIVIISLRQRQHRNDTSTHNDADTDKDTGTDNDTGTENDTARKRYHIRQQPQRETERPRQRYGQTTQQQHQQD